MALESSQDFRSDPLVKSFYKFVHTGDLRKQALSLFNKDKKTMKRQNPAIHFVPQDDYVVEPQPHNEKIEVSYEDLIE